MTSAVKTKRIPAHLEQTQRILVGGFNPGTAPVPAPPLPPLPEPPVVLPIRPPFGTHGKHRKSKPGPLRAYLTLSVGLAMVSAAVGYFVALGVIS